VIVAAVLGGSISFSSQPSQWTDGALCTVEATETNIPGVRGRVKQVYVEREIRYTRTSNSFLIYSATTAMSSEIITSPIDGVVLERLVEPDEFAAPGSTVMVVARSTR